jgi:hypothetical protein
MSKNIYLYLLALITLIACSKDVEDRSVAYPALKPAKLDTNAGNWRPILLTAANEFAVAAPIAIGSNALVAELNEIKSAQQNASSAQLEKLRFWSAGAVLRWNEIMRELVAKHNIPPVQNADGSYPVPSPSNPFAYPTFPFATPPYAARAYAYVAAAQYDALVAAHYYKKLYNRSAPYLIDFNIKALVPSSALPSYPSEDAVVIGVTVELMKLLFPTDLAYIQEKANEHRQARILSGANVRSDLEAGEALGKLVAEKFVTRARGDKAGAAVGDQALWTSLENRAIAANETPWISQENPKRPPMLPLFGKVKAFLYDSALLVNQLRPGPPPSTRSSRFQTELNEVLQISQNLSREQIRIAHFWSDGVNTYAPPGHWNAIATDEFVQLNFSEVRWARNMALLNMSLMDAAIACWDTKYFYFNPRPSQMNSAIKTVTGLPNFPAYTSGHSTFSGAAATVMGYIIGAKATQFNEMAKEASLSRLYAAIHYRSDCDSGLACGQRIGWLSVQKGRNDGADN